VGDPESLVLRHRVYAPLLEELIDACGPALTTAARRSRLVDCCLARARAGGARQVPSRGCGATVADADKCALAMTGRPLPLGGNHRLPGVPQLNCDSQDDFRS
jgi:hypothetical protein